MRKAIDLVGERFGRLVVVTRAPNKTFGNTEWSCRCDCGNFKNVQGGALKNGRSKSCGCIQKESATKHGMEGTKTYNAWASMKSRCNNQKNKFFSHYGGRGITYCKEWEKFEQFLSDMGEAPEGMSLDRINNELGYGPSNCRWTTPKEQRRNTRATTFLEFRGLSKVPTEWAEELGIPVETIRSRIKLGWTVEDALTKPVDKRKSTKKKLNIFP